MEHSPRNCQVDGDCDLKNRLVVVPDLGSLLAVPDLGSLRVVLDQDNHLERLVPGIRLDHRYLDNHPTINRQTKQNKTSETIVLLMSMPILVD